MLQYLKSISFMSVLVLMGCGGGIDYCTTPAQTDTQYPIIVDAGNFKNKRFQYKNPPVEVCFEDDAGKPCGELIVRDDAMLLKFCEFSKSSYTATARTMWTEMCAGAGKIDWEHNVLIVLYASSAVYRYKWMDVALGRGVWKMPRLLQIIDYGDSVAIKYHVYSGVDLNGLTYFAEYDDVVEGSVHAFILPKPCGPIRFERTISSSLELIEQAVQLP